MGYVRGLTKQEIFDAATAIFAQGKNPSQAKIRATLGTGSYATISKYLAEWREQNPALDTASATNTEMPDQVRSLLQQTYNAILAHAESSAVGERVEVLETENTHLRSENDQLRQDLSELAGLRAASQTQLIRLEELTRENERFQRLKSEIDHVDEIVSERDQLKSEVEQLRANSQRLEASEAHLAEELGAYQRNLETSQRRASEMADELSELRSASSKLNSQLSEQTTRNFGLISRAQLAEGTLTEKLEEIEDLKTELKIAKQTKPSSRRKGLKGEQQVIPGTSEVS